MMKKNDVFKWKSLPRFVLVGVAAFASVPGSAQAQVLGHHYRPHYWDLPTDFEGGFWFPGQTMYYSSSDRSFDSSGRSVKDPAGKTDTFFGFTIIPYFFKLSNESKWAYAFSLNTYEFRLRTPGALVANGVGSLIPALTGWTKPTQSSTLGYDILLATPFSITSSLDTKAWDLYLRGFYDLNINNWNIDTTLGYHTNFPESGSKPKDEYHLNTRLGYDIHGVTGAALRVTPYISADYQRNSTNSAYLFNAGGGVMFTHKNFMNWTIGYSKSVKGQSMPETNAVLAQIWLPL